jgi:hypothetical protein
MSRSNVKEKVEQLLADNPKLRDSDKALLGAYWASEGFIMTPEQKKKFMELTVAESITRVRRQLRDKYPGTEEVEQERFNKFEEYRDEYSGRTYMRQINGQED